MLQASKFFFRSVKDSKGKWIADIRNKPGLSSVFAASGLLKFPV